MAVLLAIDALEHQLVEDFGCQNLKQRYYGQTDISEFSEPRTIVLWSSFMAGKNLEKEILAKGKEDMWDTKLDLKETFFGYFKNPMVIDLPGFSYDKEQHDRERALLKDFFEDMPGREKKEIRKEYNKIAFEHHRKVKDQFYDSLGRDHDFVLGYFSVADVIGHLNFGNRPMMKMIYRDLDEIAESINDTYLVLSDHGMKPIGMFGDHSENGFWSTDYVDLKRPRITDFADIILKIA